MRHPYFILLLLLSSLFSLKAIPAVGQQLKLEQVKPSKEGYFLDFPGGRSVAHYFVAGPSEAAAVFRHVVLDSALRLRHERSLRVGGSGTQALGCGSNRRAALYRFESLRSGDDPAQDSTITAVIDTAGTVLSIQRLAKSGLYRHADIALQVPSDSLFLLCEPRRGTHGFVLRCLDLRQRERWQLTIKSQKHKGHLLQYAADSAFVWLVADDNMVSRRVWHTAYCVEIQTGRLVSTTLLDYHGERRLANTLLMGADHSLLVAGRSSRKRRISRKRVGDLFVTRLATDGSSLLDHCTLLGPTSPLAGLRARTYWQTMALTPTGEVRLLGQGFTSTSYGENLAMVAATRMLTLGFVGFSSTTLRSQELVSVRLNPQGEVLQNRFIPLADQNRQTFFGYVPGQLAASLAHQAGTLPVRQLLPGGQLAVLQHSTRLLLLDLDTQQVRPLREGVEAGTIWQARPGSLLLYRAVAHGKRRALELERLTF